MSRLKVLLLSSCAQTGADVSNQLAALPGELEILDPVTRPFTERDADAVFLDLDSLSHPGQAREILEKWAARSPVIILSTQVSPSFVVQKIRLGAANFVGKHELDKLPDVLKATLAGEHLKGSGPNEGLHQIRLILEGVKDYAILMLDPEGRVLNWNIGAERLFGYRAGEVVGSHFSFCYPVEELDASTIELSDVLAKGRLEHEGLRVRKDGTVLWVNTVTTPLRDHGGQVLGFVRVCRDISERKAAAEMQRKLLAEREEVLAQLRVILDRMPIGCILNDINFRFTYWNSAAEKIFGFTLAEVKGRHPFGTITPPEAEANVGQIFRRLAAGDMTANGIGPNRTKAGRRIICQWSNTPLVSAAGQFMGILSMCQDVTARIQAEEAVQESEARFQQLADNIQECFWLSSVHKAQFIYISPAFDKIWGFSRQALFEKATAWLQAVHPEDRQRIEDAIDKKELTGTFNEEYRIIRPGGAIRWVRERAFPIRNSEGQIYRVAGLAEDVTAQKELERQFLQAQKMESIGRLAGGVAHDFGNMLTAISSFSRLALDNIPPGSPARSDLEQVLKASDRAATVTKQLLAFARRQVFEPSIVQLNEIILNLEKMLHRLVRENIRLRINPGNDLSKILADPNQLEQALINLVVNAVDAMPVGGELTIETANLSCHECRRLNHIHIPAGEHVLLRVQDTGEGMSEEIQAQVFEPFFTTKEQGKGTGLGLATVYGIVQQNGGFIDVSSQQGAGTSFIIIFKRART